jgi:5-methylcytosine-specific restriction endonuclease McrBC regulatory subunit McrC
MIVLGEHFGYERSNNRYHLNDDNLELCLKNNLSHPIQKSFLKNKDSLCFSFQKSEENEFQFETSFFIGVDWIIKDKLPIYVRPKLNIQDKEIDYLKILFEALEEPENLNHLDDLFSIDTISPLISITQKEDLLTPLIIVEFVRLLQHIVRKGLKKSYYKVTDNLSTKVKGKILIGQTIKQNHFKHKFTQNVCSYEEFGYNSIENRILKKALYFIKPLILKEGRNNVFASLRPLLNYLDPAFSQVSMAVDSKELRTPKSNPFYKEYAQGIELAIQILKKYGNNITNTESEIVKTPPFWIDMTKLFELYVFKKLREVFPRKNEVKYHFKTNYQELDYVLNSKDRNIKMVIDAKYKNKYFEGGIGKDDARQISGYARLKTVYEELSIENTKELIDYLS